MTQVATEDAALAREMRGWLVSTALPLWLDRGVDWTRGGFFDALSMDTLENAVGYKRLRVLARQIYTFSASVRLGLPGGRDALDHGIAFLLERARDEKGGYHNRFDLDGNAIDSVQELYDLAFVLFALAHAYSVTKDTALRDEAARLMRYIEATLRHERGGFHESIPVRLPRRQNPHMHLLEATLAWASIAPMEFQPVVEELLGLFHDHFFEASSGALSELFDDSLNMIAEADGRVLEPGHQFEWVWLLDSANRLLQGPRHGPAASALYEFATTRGIARASGIPYGGVAVSGEVISAVTRPWVLAEWLKAETVIDRPDRRARMSRAWDGMRRFLATPQPGLWYEFWDESSQSFRVESSAPASTLYHLTLAIEVATEALDSHGSKPGQE